MRSIAKRALTRIAPLTLAFVLGACATQPPAVEMGELENAADGTSITIKRGGELTVRLDARLSTGFQWQGPTAVAPVLAPIGQPVYMNKADDPRNLSQGGFNVFRFKGEQPGTTTLQFNYKRPWEANVAPAKSVRYTVVVAP